MNKSFKNSASTFLSQSKTGASLALVLLLSVGLGACSTEKKKNHAKEMAAKYWQDKAAPGKSFDVQVVEAEKADDGMYRVKGIVDGEERVGLFNPESETFSEGYYTVAKEKTRKVAELEQEVKYWKEKAESLEKENYKLKVRMNIATESKKSDSKSDSEKAE